MMYSSYLEMLSTYTLLGSAVVQTTGNEQAIPAFDWVNHTKIGVYYGYQNQHENVDAL